MQPSFATADSTGGSALTLTRRSMGGEILAANEFATPQEWRGTWDDYLTRPVPVDRTTPCGNDAVRTLSGGMQRRLAIARALLHDPALLLLDEPTLGVDVEARHQIWSHVRALRAQGRTVLLTTNYLDEAEALCDRVAILRGGRLVADDTPAALVARAGRCLELDCTPERASHLKAVLRGHPGVLRTEVGEAGLTVYVNGHTTPEVLVSEMMVDGALQGFRLRSPDLVEVFRALAVDR